MIVMFKGRQVIDIDVANIHAWDYPDFCDAYLCSASWQDGTPLTENELDELQDSQSHLAHELAHARWL